MYLPTPGCGSYQFCAGPWHKPGLPPSRSAWCCCLHTRASPRSPPAHCLTSRTSAGGSTKAAEVRTSLREDNSWLSPAVFPVLISTSVSSRERLQHQNTLSLPTDLLSPGCTASMYQVSMPYTAASTMSIIMDRPRLKSSPSTGDWLMVLHWIPTPATSYSAKYLEPRPKAVVDIRDCRRAALISYRGNTTGSRSRESEILQRCTSQRR